MQQTQKQRKSAEKRWKSKECTLFSACVRASFPCCTAKCKIIEPCILLPLVRHRFAATKLSRRHATLDPRSVAHNLFIFFFVAIVVAAPAMCVMRLLFLCNLSQLVLSQICGGPRCWLFVCPHLSVLRFCVCLYVLSFCFSRCCQQFLSFMSHNELLAATDWWHE